MGASARIALSLFWLSGVVAVSAEPARSADSGLPKPHVRISVKGVLVAASPMPLRIRPSERLTNGAGFGTVFSWPVSSQKWPRKGGRNYLLCHVLRHT